MQIDHTTQFHLEDFCKKAFRPKERQRKWMDMMDWLEGLSDEDAQFELDGGWRRAFLHMEESCK